MNQEYNYDYIKLICDHNLTVRLFGLKNAPLIISFLFHNFKNNNKIVIPNTELKTSLSDYLYSLNQLYGENTYLGSAQNYLEDWANAGFLKKRYTPNSDEPVFELTPASEKALDFIKDLEKREFVGTVSRFLKIFDILNEIAYKSTTDPQERINELIKKKLEIEKEIAKIEAGNIEKLNETQIKELYYEVYDTTRKLLADFKQIEYNFLELDRKIREQQIDTNLKKGKLLDDVFQYQDSMIWDTDQGRSFKTFWDFLISQSKRDELTKLLGIVCNLPEIKALNRDDFLERIEVNLVDAGDKVNRTNHDMIEQLRRYIDDRSYIENKRIIEIIKGIKHYALQVKDNLPKDKEFFSIDGDPQIGLVMDRPTFNPGKNPEIRSITLEEGDAGSIDTQALYSQIHINPEQLRQRIHALHKSSTQLTLKQITEVYPIENGLEELIAYFNIAAKSDKSVVNDEKVDTIIIWNRYTNKRFRVEAPQVIFCK